MAAVGQKNDCVQIAVDWRGINRIEDSGWKIEFLYVDLNTNGGRYQAKIPTEKPAYYHRQRLGVRNVRMLSDTAKQPLELLIRCTAAQANNLTILADITLQEGKHNSTSKKHVVDLTDHPRFVDGKDYVIHVENAPTKPDGKKRLLATVELVKDVVAEPAKEPAVAGPADDDRAAKLGQQMIESGVAGLKMACALEPQLTGPVNGFLPMVAAIIDPNSGAEFDALDTPALQARFDEVLRKINVARINFERACNTGDMDKILPALQEKQRISFEVIKLEKALQKRKPA